MSRTIRSTRSSVPRTLGISDGTGGTAAAGGSGRSAPSSCGAREVRPFADKQIELVRTFADQAVIAIENVRLFTELGARNRELTESLEQQTATSEILRAISGSPTDAQPVFDTIAQHAGRICDARHCAVFRFDGALVHLVAHDRLSAEALREYQQTYPLRLEADTVSSPVDPRPSGPSHPGSIERSGKLGARAADRSGRRVPVRHRCPDATRRQPHRRHRRVAKRRGWRTSALHRKGDRAAPDLRRPGGDRDRERAAVPGAGGTDAARWRARSRSSRRSARSGGRSARPWTCPPCSPPSWPAPSSSRARAAAASTSTTKPTQEFHLQASHRTEEELVEVLRARPVRLGEGATGQAALRRAPVEVADTLERPGSTK